MIPLQNCKFIQILAPIDIGAATATDTEIDTKGWHYLVVHVSIGVISTNMTSFTINESDTVNASGATNAIVTFTPQLATGGDATQQVAFIDLRNRRRYIRIEAVSGGVALTSVTGILWRGDESPSTIAMRGVSEQFFLPA